MARMDPRRWSLAAQIFGLQVLVAVLVVGAGLGAAYVQARRSSEQQATARVLAVAHTVLVLGGAAGEAFAGTHRGAHGLTATAGEDRAVAS